MHNTVEYAAVNTGQRWSAETGLVDELPAFRASAAPGDLPETARVITDPTTGYREPPMTRARHQGRPPPTYPPGRYCTTDSCTARLSIYNPTDHCGLHSPRRHPRIRNRRGW